MSYEKAPSSGAFLPVSLMYFLSGEPMHDLSGVDSSGCIRERWRVLIKWASRSSNMRNHPGASVAYHVPDVELFKPFCRAIGDTNGRQRQPNRRQTRRRSSL